MPVLGLRAGELLLGLMNGLRCATRPPHGIDGHLFEGTCLRHQLGDGHLSRQGRPVFSGRLFFRWALL